LKTGIEFLPVCFSVAGSLTGARHQNINPNINPTVPAIFPFRKDDRVAKRKSAAE
jgi:hypothetical protein